MERQALIAELIKIFGPDEVLHTPEDRMVYEYDFSIDSHLPDIVVFPAHTEQVSQLMALAARENLVVVPRGAGTGLSGGAIAVNGGVVVSMARMKRLLKFDRENRYAVVQPGHVNLELSTALA